MADWGPWVGDYLGASCECSPTPGDSAHTKGAWSYSVTDTNRADGLLVNFEWEQNYTTIRTLLFDVGIGAGSDILINNLMVCPPAGGAAVSRAGEISVFFPVSVPPDQIRMRSQSSMASHATTYALTKKLISGLPTVGSVVDTYGVDTANTKGTTLTAPDNPSQYGSWTQIAASTNRIKALVFAIGHGQADMTTFSDQYFDLSIGIGAAGSEVELAEFLQAGGSSQTTKTLSPGYLGPLYVDIPEGTRLSARVRKQWNSASQRTLDVVIYGVR